MRLEQEEERVQGSGRQVAWVAWGLFYWPQAAWCVHESEWFKGLELSDRVEEGFRDFV